MPSSTRSAALAAIAATALIPFAAVPALAAPPFFGSSFATTTGPGDPVLGRSGGPVRVGAHLPPSLECSRVVSADPAPGYHDNPGMNALHAAPVVVTLAPGGCGADWQRQWVSFVVPHPVATDILGLVFQDSSGRTLCTEKLAISTSGGSPTGGDND